MSLFMELIAGTRKELWSSILIGSAWIAIAVLSTGVAWLVVSIIIAAFFAANTFGGIVDWWIHKKNVKPF